MRKTVKALFATLLACLIPPPALADAPERLDWDGLDLPAIDGGKHAAELFKGRVVLVVNTASRCGFTPQYAGLQALWLRYRDQGLVVLGVPSNDFAGQEPGSNAQVQDFCQVNYGVDFPLLEKQVVTGARAHPLYRWAAARTGAAGLPRWNFHKLLIGRDGRLIDWFSSVTAPDAAKLVAAVEAALAEKRP